MNTVLKSLIVGLSLIAGSNAAAVQLPQVETEHSCCLASEWKAMDRSSAPQSSESFCCLANEWRAPETVVPEHPVQSDELSCCLASEWQVL